jgi:DNA modification methylase
VMNEWTSPDGRIRLINADCLAVLPELEADCIVTDPPYPDYHVELYGECDLSFLNDWTCRQFVFWSTRVDFPLSWQARHVWDKRKGGAGSAYEFIYERNGSREQWVWPFVSIQNPVRAQFSKDVFTGHPSQKPFRLIEAILALTDAETILDPFAGSCTTAIACIRTNRRCIAIEKERKYWEIGVQRCKAEYARTVLFNEAEAVA